jgi:hypothetical protein
MGSLRLKSCRHQLLCGTAHTLRQVFEGGKFSEEVGRRFGSINVPSEVRSANRIRWATLEVPMADNAVVVDGVAGFCRMFQIPWISRHKVLAAFCEAMRRVLPPTKPYLLSMSEKRRELS